jgi:hypothetical protein
MLLHCAHCGFAVECAEVCCSLLRAILLLCAVNDVLCCAVLCLSAGVSGEMFATIERALDERTIGHNPERLNLMKVWCGGGGGWKEGYPLANGNSLVVFTAHQKTCAMLLLGGVSLRAWGFSLFACGGALPAGHKRAIRVMQDTCGCNLVLYGSCLWFVRCAPNCSQSTCINM